MNILNKQSGFQILSNTIAKWLALGFGSGLAPKAPGTFGTLAAVPIFLLMQDLAFSVYIILTVLICLIGFWACGAYSKQLGVHDHGSIVWDEIAGYLITMAFAPAGWIWIVVGFILFRFFDILKPWPINVLDKKVHGGLGIMLDDMLAGLFAGLLLMLIAAITL